MVTQGKPTVLLAVNTPLTTSTGESENFENFPMISNSTNAFVDRIQQAVEDVYKRQNGIHIPQLIQAATQKHMTDTNPVALFVSEMNENGWRIDTGSNFEWLAAIKTISDLTTVQVYNLYKEWCKENGYKPLANNTFGRELYRLGYESRCV